MKKLLASFMALSITASSAGVLVACGNNSSDYNKDEINYLMEQYAKSVYIGNKYNANAEWVFTNNVEYQNMSFLNTSTGFKSTKYTRYNQLFKNYFPKEKFLASDIKYDGFTNSNTKFDGSSEESLNSILGLLSTFLTSFVGTSSGFASLASIVKTLVQLPLVMDKIQGLISYLGDLLNNDQVALLQSSFSNDAYAAKKLSYNDALHSSYIGLANGINLLSGVSDNLDEYNLSDSNNAYNNGTATTDILANLKNINLSGASFGNKVEGIAKLINFLRTLMVYLNHFWSESNNKTLSVLGSDTVTSDGNVVDLKAFFKILQDIDTQSSDTNQASDLSKLLGPLLSYTTDDLTIDLGVKNLNADGFNPDTNKSLMEENGGGLALAFNQIISSLLGDNNTFSFSKKIDVVLASLTINIDNMNISTLLSRIVSTILSNNVLKISASVNIFGHSSDMWGTIKPILMNTIKSKINNDFIFNFLNTVLDGKKPILQIISPEVKVLLDQFNIGNFDLTDEMNIDFNKLSSALGILKNLSWLVSNDSTQYDEWWKQAGLVDGTLTTGSPLESLQSFLSSLKGVTKILTVLENLLSEISAQKKVVNAKITEEFEDSNIPVKSNKIVAFNVDKNNFEFDYVIGTESIDVFLKHYDDGFRVTEVSVSENN